MTSGRRAGSVGDTRHALARAVGWVALGACAPSTPSPPSPGGSAQRDGAAPQDGAGVRDDAAVADGAPKALADGAPKVAAAAVGTVRVLVRWPDAPAARRTSPGATACGTARAPSMVVDELWGVAEVAVMLELAGAPPSAPSAPSASSAPTSAVRLTVSACAVTPRLVVATPGQVLLVQSGELAPIDVRVRRRAWHELAQPGPQESASVVALPWQGHAVALRAAGPGSWSVELAQASQASHPSHPSGPHAADDAAHVVWSPHPYAAVTDGDGLAVLRDVPAGAHQVVAWLPARGGGRGATLRGEVRVEADQTAEVVLTP